MKIIVDADACPVKSIIVGLAKQHNIQVIMLSNLSHIIDDGYSKAITVDQSAESVDIAIYNMVSSDDVVVTQDYGVAAMVLGKGASAINQNGLVYSNENIDELLFSRHISAKQRRSGQKTKGPPKRKKTDDDRFSEELKKNIDLVVRLMENILNYNQPVSTILEKRVSVRSYNGDSLPDNLVEEIKSYCKQLEAEVDNKLRFIYLDRIKTKSMDGIKLGTYGFIKGAPAFICVALKDDCSLIKAGYYIQALICYLTSLGLGTCWIGGTFSKDNFGKACNLSEDENIRIVVPLGYASKKRGFISYAMNRKGERNREDYSKIFFDQNFDKPIDSLDGMKYKLPLKMLRIAPSAMNAQPWAIVKDGENFHFFKTKSRGDLKKDSVDIHTLDMGIAMFNFEATVIDTGLSGKFVYEGAHNITAPDGFKCVATWVDNN